MDIKKETKNLKILIVDDEKGVRETLNFVLTRKRYVVEEAENGKDALKKISKNKPDIILLDAMMPVMDGFETCRRLRANIDTQNIPIIFCSATHINEAKSGKVKVDDYIEKPFTVANLCKKIDTLLKNKKRE